MNKLIEFSRRAMLLFLAGLFFVCALAVGMYFIVIKPAVNYASHPAGSGGQLVQSTGPRNTYTDPQSGPVFLVPADRIPKTQAQRYSAPADTLLADRWANNTGADTEVGPTRDSAHIPSADRQALMTSVGSFMKAWETFTPPAPRATASSAYAESLQPWVDPADLSDVVNRVDNAQGGGVCPAAGCSVGSSWANVYVWSSSNVRSYNGTDAYVTLFGSVTYHDPYTDGPLDGVSFQRSYGLLLHFSNGRWLVTRASAATDGRNG